MITKEQKLKELKLDKLSFEKELERQLSNKNDCGKKISQLNSSYNIYKEEIERCYYQLDRIEEDIYLLENNVEPF